MTAGPDILKGEIRAEMRRRRAALAKPWVDEASGKVQSAVSGLAEFRAAHGVACYIASPAEVQTSLLIRESWAGGKALCVPSWAEDRRAYVLVRFDCGDEVSEGPCGIPQPRRSVPPRDRMDVVLVPGVAFDASLNRLGHGCGHYDRLLADAALAGAFKVGMAFGFQIVGSVPAGRTDVKMDIVVTEDRIIGPVQTVLTGKTSRTDAKNRKET